MSDFKIKFDEKAFEKAMLDIARDEVSNMDIEIECPTCGKSFSAREGINICPHCGESVDLNVKVDF